VSDEPLDDGEIVEIPRPEPVSVPVALRAVSPALPREPSAPTPATYTLLTVAEVVDRPSPRWLVRRVIRQGEMVFVYGAPSCGKTFLVLDLVLAIATGREWWSYGTVRGSVLYLAGEGVAGLGKRILAWGREREVDVRTVPMRVLPHAVAVIDAEAFKTLGATVAALDPKPAVIVVDTLARYMVGGDENSAQDSGVFLDRCAQLGAASGAAVLIVHHSRKDSDIERGSSAIRGAADVMLQVTYKDHVTTVKGSKAKDAPLLDPIYLTRKVVHLGTDEDGESVTSLVFERGEAPLADAEPVDAATSAPEPEVDRGAKIRQALSRHFKHLGASGTALFNVSGLKRSTFYEALDAEVEAGRIKAIGRVRTPLYVLTEDAPEYVPPPPEEPASPSPSPGESVNSIPDSPGGSPSETREFESESGGPCKGAPDRGLGLALRGRKERKTSGKSKTATKKNPHPGEGGAP
jgi:hypothetical protein